MNEGSLGNVALFRKSLRTWQAEFRRERGGQANGGTSAGRTLRPGRLARRKATERKGQEG
jgi:hypothetical protein